MSILRSIQRFVIGRLEYIAFYLPAIRALLVENRQLGFLLKQAPILQPPTDLVRIMGISVKYAYIHPTTIARIDPLGLLIEKHPARWVVTPLMPEGGVIFSPNEMPGTAHLQGRCACGTSSKR